MAAEPPSESVQKPENTPEQRVHTVASPHGLTRGVQVPIHVSAPCTSQEPKPSIIGINLQPDDQVEDKMSKESKVFGLIKSIYHSTLPKLGFVETDRTSIVKSSRSKVAINDEKSFDQEIEDMHRLMEHDTLRLRAQNLVASDASEHEILRKMDEIREGEL